MSSKVTVPKMTRVDLAELFAENGYRKGAEIGTARGTYAYTLCRKNTEACIYCIDPWEVYDEYSDYTDQRVMEHNFLKTCRRLEHFDNYKIIREYSEFALRLFEDGGLDFVYIDANHSYDYVTYDITEWSKKVRTGGIVSGHDYGEHKEVTKAVDDYVEAFGIDEWFVIGTPDRAQSWYWVKP